MHGSLPVAVIDEELAERYWPGQDPLGRHLSFDNADDPNADRYAIVGVVGHAAHESLDAEARVQFYRTYRQGSPTAISVVVRTTGRPTAMAEAVRHAVQSVDPNMPLSRLGTMEDLVGESVGQRRLSAMLFGGFALLALSLACLGIYGVMSYGVAQRRQEIGVRIALGAGAASVVGLLVKQGGMLVLAGLVFGLAGALALTRLLRNQLFGIEATDPATFAAVATLLLATALAATWLPAWRAANLDPVKALREE
jgi:putative ABC transport system permease protein